MANSNITSLLKLARYTGTTSGSGFINITNDMGINNLHRVIRVVVEGGYNYAHLIYTDGHWWAAIYNINGELQKNVEKTIYVEYI